MAKPIYPVKVKPPSGIRRWQDWPDDVRPTLERWNSQKGGLSFCNWDLFKCEDCGEFCEEHNGCVFGRFTPSPAYVCDGCVIARVRSHIDGSPSNRKEC